MSIPEYLLGLIKSIRREEPEFSDVLYKWFRLLCKSIKQVVKATKESEEDIIHDFLLELHRANLSYKTEFYRYKNHLYEVDFWDGSIVHIVSNHFNTQFKCEVWVPVANIEKVVKSSFSSFIYHQIQQYKVDRINACYCKKNGYKVVGKVEKSMMVHEGDYKKKVKRKVRKFVKSKLVSTEELLDGNRDSSITIGSTLKSPYLGPSEVYDETRMLEESGRVSEVTKAALHLLLMEPTMKEGTLASNLGCSRRKTRVVKGMLMRQFFDVMEFVEVERCYFDGAEFRKLSEQGDQMLLGLPSGKNMWVDAEDVVIHPSGIKPFRLIESELR